MSDGCHGPQELKDRIVQSRVHRERDQFIATICEDDVCRLASSYHDGDLCSFFKSLVRGSYNICYFVHFTSNNSNEDVEKWVVRVPLAPCLAYGGNTKLESEIATMQLVRDKTTIPLPKIHAYSLGEGHEPLSSFIILKYIEGQKLSYGQLRDLSDEQREHLYTSLADVHIQLRKLEFPSIGCLTRVLEGFEVRKKFNTIDINMQELEGLQPSKIQKSFCDHRNLLTSANDYTAMLLQIADNAFAEGRSSVSDEEQGEDALYHLHIFCKYAESWVDHSLDQGPFVLVHGGFEPFNLIEWSRVVPLQFFKPPLWLKNPDTTKLAYNFVYKDYLKRFDQFLEIVRTREREKYGNQLLADEWTKAKENSGFLVANALENWTNMDWFANRYINWKCYREVDLTERVKAFMNDPVRKAFMARKLHEGAAYRAKVDQPDNTIVKGAHRDSGNSGEHIQP
ncbi:hypothetical protein EAF04_009550 [Stromatinia cepivora]|nr:hypothetical protein EAF04_009550 [Stromatinia cepivora]